MSGPPPPPQVSPDGKFYWDGTRWVPMQQEQAPAQPQPIAQPQPQSQRPPSGYEVKKKGHFWRNGLLGCAGIIALIIFIPWCAGLAGISTSSSRSSSSATSSPAAASPRSTPSAAKLTACSPQPCASAFSLTVRISGLNRNSPVGFFKPEAGNHFVLMQMTMHNDGGQDTKHINPFDFKLRDAGGVSHDITFSDTPGCDVWSSVDLAPGATYGPKPLCFQASGDPSGKLTLLWSPDIFSPTVEIPLQ